MPQWTASPSQEAHHFLHYLHLTLPPKSSSPQSTSDGLFPITETHQHHGDPLQGGLRISGKRKP
ncbi:MAG: hypothetical protein ABC578_07100 [Candidatus Methanosuratincola petrocarbonis]